jgi:hypothetical protein
MLYNSNLKIIVIKDNLSVSEMKTFKLNESLDNEITVISLPFTLFFTTYFIKKVLIENKNIHQCIFLFQDMDYLNITIYLGLFKIIVSGGSNTKKHILSPVQLRLSRFLIGLLPFVGNDVSKSFHYDRFRGRANFDLTDKEAQQILVEGKKSILEKENMESKEQEILEKAIEKILGN